MLWLAGVVMALAWLLRPAPDAQTVRPIASAFLPPPAPPETVAMMELAPAAFNPTLDLNPVSVTPFVEHLPGDWLAPSVRQSPTVMFSSGGGGGEPPGLDEVTVTSWPAGPAPLEEWEPWIVSRPVIQAYPELAPLLREALARDLASGRPGIVPWLAEATVEQVAHERYGWARSAMATPVGTPTDPGVLDTRPYPYNSP